MTVDTSRSEEHRGTGESGAGAGYRPAILDTAARTGRRPAPGGDWTAGAQRRGAPRAFNSRTGARPEQSPGVAVATRHGSGFADRLADAVVERFRLPAAEDPAPRTRRVVGLCAWAAVLGIGGMTVAVRALVGLMTVGASWYGPTVVAIGLLGLLCTVGAFASVHRRRLPWVMLTTATGALLAGWILTGAAR